ncbi:MAG TPA: FAD-binding oxidoreductase [Stellaceae bacterium]|nr:FAD-binding oxidoreductase [Stellaceae bacterium]
MELSALRSRIAGTVVENGAPDYPKVRDAMVWNGLKPARSPDVIVRVKSAADVATAMEFARANRMKVAVRGGGHSWCGLPLRVAGVLIDLSALDEITVDAANCTGTVQPHLSNRDVIRALTPYGLAFPVGHCPTVKASGFLLSGGIGWNSHLWGPACLSVIGIDLVMADGRQLHASATENPDLFWAARGGGAGFFAVATRYHLKLYKLPATIRSSTFYYPITSLAELGSWLDAISPRLDRSVELSAFLVSAPPELSEACRPNGGKVCMVTANAFVETEAAAHAALQPLADGLLEAGCLARRIEEPTPFETLFALSGSLWPEGLRYHAELMWSHRSVADILVALRDHFVAAPSPETVILFALYGGWRNGLPDRAAQAFSTVAPVYGGVWTAWHAAADDGLNTDWHRRTVELLKPFTVGHYLGETDIVAHPEHAAASFAPESYARLMQLRDRYDPDHLFHGLADGLG